MQRSFFFSFLVTTLLVAAVDCCQANSAIVTTQEHENYTVGQHVEVKTGSDWQTGFVTEKLRGPAYKVNFFDKKNGAKNTDFFFPPEMREGNGMGFEPTAAETRTWISTKGTQAVASLVYSDGENVILKRKRKTVVVSIDKLSQADQDYLDELKTQTKAPTKTTRQPTPLKDLIGMDKDELFDKMKNDRARMSRDLERLDGGLDGDDLDGDGDDLDGDSSPTNNPFAKETDSGDSESAEEELDADFDDLGLGDASSMFKEHLKNLPEDMQRDVKQHLEVFKNQLKESKHRSNELKTRRSNSRTTNDNNTLSSAPPKAARPSIDSQQTKQTGQNQVAPRPISAPDQRVRANKVRTKRIGMGVAYFGIFLMISIGFVFVAVRVVTAITKKNEF